MFYKYYMSKDVDNINKSTNEINKNINEIKENQIPITEEEKDIIMEELKNGNFYLTLAEEMKKRISNIYSKKVPYTKFIYALLEKERNQGYICENYINEIDIEELSWGSKYDMYNALKSSGILKTQVKGDITNWGVLRKKFIKYRDCPSSEPISTLAVVKMIVWVMTIIFVCGILNQ